MDIPSVCTQIKQTLEAAGWHDAFAGYAEAGIDVKGFGEVALQYENEAESTLLRLEFTRSVPTAYRSSTST